MTTIVEVMERAEKLLIEKIAEVDRLNLQLGAQHGSYELKFETQKAEIASLRASELRRCAELDAKPNKYELWSAIRGRDEKINKLVKELAAARQELVSEIMKLERIRLLGTLWRRSSRLDFHTSVPSPMMK
jgi:hypothetical protein